MKSTIKFLASPVWKPNSTEYMSLMRALAMNAAWEDMAFKQPYRNGSKWLCVISWSDDGVRRKAYGNHSNPVLAALQAWDKAIREKESL
jgi:hypothetical protein